MGYNQYNKKDLYQEYKVNHFQFFDIKKSEFSYILGLLWADGNLGIDKRSVCISCKYNDNINSDFNTIKMILEKTGDWKSYHYDRYDKRNKKTYKSGTFMTSNRHLYDFLIEMDYDKKSRVSPTKILNHIPIDFHKHFFRGYSDGDGSFYSKGNVSQYVVVSTIEQDWSFIINLFSELQIEKYDLMEVNQKNGCSSKVRIANKWDIIKLGDWLYKDSEGIRLERKYQKYIEIKNSNVQKSSPKWNQDDINFLKKNYSILGIDICSKHLNRTKKSVYFKMYKLKKDKFLHPSNLLIQ